jgi:quinoprotein glucose dehydrogenase
MRFTGSVCLIGVLVVGAAVPDSRMIEWPFYGGDQAGTKWSRAADINRANVSTLEVAWTWKPAEKPLPEFRTQPGSFENTPLMIDNVLYVSTPYNRVVALDAESGRELWAYDPRAYEAGQVPNGTGFVHRGVAAWRDNGKLRIS